MNKLQPDEKRLIGGLIVENGQVRGDAVSERIDWLLSHHLEKISDSPKDGAWETLYRDPNDGRYWERTYPQSEMHGGGPRQLRCMTAGEAAQKYGADVISS
jgi:hypothetical protein